MIAYTGTYRLEGDRWITQVDVAWNPEWVGTEQTRFFAIDGDVLKVHTPWRVMPNWARERPHPQHCSFSALPLNSGFALLATTGVAGLVALLLSQIAEINNLMTVRHAHRSNQTQRPKQKTRNSPAVAVACLLGGNGFRETSADQMGDQHKHQRLEFHGEGAVHHLG